MAHDILIVDDEPDIRSLIDGILSDEGYETRQAANSDAALAHFRQRRPSLVILDIWLANSRLDGLGILDAMHREEPQVPCVMISGHGTIETAVAALQAVTAAKSTVLRDGALRTVPSSELVCGDILVLAEGDAIGADGRLLTATMLRVAGS